ncbi:MAG: hypothetical protein C7B43_21350, partial [Sulfobacillus benefaciens]
MYRPLLGVSKIGHPWAMAGGTSAQHAITRGDRFWGNRRIHRTVAPGDLISPVLKGIREALMTWDGTDPKDGTPLSLGDGAKRSTERSQAGHRNRPVKTGCGGMASLVS